ncbi:MAG TPA: iron-sulfur cluster repair di-iron protein [Candidatus Atribacteria bacterium]|nr:iron-sulfur cluster repair di-iron protein [Candidatus Atribacteria bacterium]
MSQFSAQQSIGEIVAMMPKAGDVFRKYRIDFCCGGHRPLAEAIREQGLDEQEVLKALDDMYEETKKTTSRTDFLNISSSDLIDYVVNKHHAYLKTNLPIVSELTTTILRVHGPHHMELFDVHKQFHALKTELEQHLIKEEELLFPLIKQHDAEPSDELIEKINKVMKETEDEHVSAGDILKELRRITKEYEVPAGVCPTFEKAYHMLQEVEADLFRHIHLENNILFRRYAR